ncbi:hypothetical protein AAC387_Pa07g3351 [Persea americana]
MVITAIKQANKIWEELEGYRKKLARAETVFAASKTANKPEGTKPTNRTGFLGLIGPKVDTIDFCNEKVKELVPKLENEQSATIQEKQQASALIFFTSKMAAASASQTLHSKMIDSWTIMEAPEPCQLIWKNLSIKFWARQITERIVYFIVFLTVVFYMIPITFVSAFTTLKNLRKLLPFLKVIVDRPTLKTVLEAYMPQLTLIVFLALLPNSLKTILDKPRKIISMLGGTLPGNATFFLTFVALKFFVGYGLALSRLVPLIIYHLKRKYLCKTEVEIKEAWAPGEVGFVTRVSNDMLIITIALCYSVIAPLIIPFGVVYFGLGWLVLRNQVKYRT